MNQNDAYRHLMDALPADVARRKAMGDIKGALRLIDQYLAHDCQRELFPRLEAEKHRLERLGYNYSLDRTQALELIRREWKACTEEQFDALVDARRIDWRMVDGRMKFHSRFLNSLRLYPSEAPGLKQTAEDHTQRDEMLSRMEREGELTARITLKATVRASMPCIGKEVEAWLPFPADCPQQSEIELLEATPGYVLGPAGAEARTVYWKSRERDSFEVVYRYRHRAVYVDPYTLKCDAVQPDFDTQEALPHIAFTPYLRALAARLTQGKEGPIQKAGAIYDYIAQNVDYRYQPDYIQLDDIADSCAKELRGDCGVMALLFITLCRIAGVPARWQSGLHVTPQEAGAHDWAMFYAAPYGWLFADPSFGVGGRRGGEPERTRHYFGNLDPCRMVANSVFQAPLTPPDPFWRHDPYDNQLGELAVDGVGMDGRGMERSVEVVDFVFE